MYLDLLLLFVIILFAIVGYIQGFVKQILSVLCWISIFFFASPLAHWLKTSSGIEWFEKAPLLVNWGISALMIIGLFMITNAIIHYARKGSELESTDRWIGTAIGTAKGVLVCFLFSIFFQVIPEHIRERFDEIHADSQSSWFVRGSSSMLESKAISLMEHLAKVRDELKKGELGRSTASKLNPFHVDVSADRE